MGADALRADVVVVGAGMAGHVAALAAAQSGASVLLMEKGSDHGGSSVRSGGGMVFAGTDHQRAAGVHDDAESLREDLLRTGRHLNDARLVDVYVNDQIPTYEWLREQGVEFTYNPVPHLRRVHTVNPRETVDLLHRQVEDHPAISYVARTTLERFVRASSGSVNGLIASTDAGRVTVHANRGVIVASGGFSRAKDLVETFAPQWLAAAPMGGAHNTGDGLRAAMACGAKLADMAHVEATFGASIRHFPDLEPHTETEERLLFPNVLGAVMLNLEGQRFVNESLNYKILAPACATQTGGVAVQVFDQSVVDRGLDNGGPLDLAAAHSAGDVLRADTVEDLAELVGLPAETVQATVESYNRSVAAGEDDAFGRADDRIRLDRAPFFAYPSRPGLTTTYCGVAVDEDMRVLDVFDEPIRGLYAAGEVVGGLHGGGYYSGSALGKAAILGRRAGRAAAEHRAPAEPAST